MQIDEADCGVAALATIFNFNKLYIPLSKLKTFFNLDKNGTSMYHIVNVAEQFSLKATSLHGDINGLKQLTNEKKDPFIAHVLKDNGVQHFVVVKKMFKKKVIIFDPGTGNSILSLEQFDNVWTGHVILFEQNKSFKPENLKFSFSEYFSPLFQYKKDLLFVFICSLVISAISFMGVKIYQNLIDVHIIGTSETQYPIDITSLFFEIWSNKEQMLLALIAMYIFQNFLDIVKDYLISNTSKNIELKLKTNFFEKILRLKLNTFQKKKTGEILTRIDDIELMSSFLSNTVITTSINLLMSILGAMVLIRISSTLFNVILGVIIIYVVFSMCVIPFMARTNRIILEKNAIIISLFKELLDGIEIIKSFSREPYSKNRLNKLTENFVNTKQKLNIMGSVFSNIIDSVEQIGIVLVLLIGSNLVYMNLLTLGELLAFESLIVFFISPIKGLVQVQSSFQQYKVSFERLLEIEDMTTETYEEKNQEIYNYDIEFKNVSFFYDESNIILNEFCLEIPFGEKVFIDGGNGTGKSTLVKLLNKFIEPVTGSVFIGGHDYTLFSVTEIRKNIIYIPQETYIFSGTLKENLFFNELNSDADNMLEKILQMGVLTNLLSDLPLGIDTYITERGTNLSGGQRQLIGLCRAFLTPSKIMIFDECTSQMDRMTEDKIMEFILNNMPETSCIFISHGEYIKKHCSRTIDMNSLGAL